MIRSIPWMFLVACHAPEPGARPPRGEPGPTWTVAVWMDGDNDLEAYVPSDLDELERAATDDVHIVVQADRIDGYSRKDGDWTGTRRYEIVADQGEGVVSPVLEDLGERDMGSHEELAGFLAWVAEEHPADHLALVMWNHGGGFWIASDDTDGNKLDLNRGELDLALADHVAEHGKLDVVAFDACNMGQWETAYSLHDEALVFVASQAWVNYGGYAYDEAFPSLSAGATPAELGDALARSTMGNDEKTHAAVDLARMPELHAAIDELAAAYLDAPGGVDAFVDVREAARGLDRQWDEYWLDLGDVADGSGFLDASEIAAAGVRVREVLDGSMIGRYGDARHEWASGLTIFSDTSRESWIDKYETGEWADTRWTDLLRATRADR